MRLLLRVLFLAGLLVCVSALPAAASVGVGIQADPVLLAGPAHPGGTFTLPAVYVVNTGSQAESVSVTVQRIAKQPAGLDVPPSWVLTGDVPDSLAPGQATRIPLRLVTPAGARAGHYSSDIVVTGTVQADPGSPVRFSAAAETGLEFSIVPAPPPGLPYWKIWLTAGLLLAFAVALLVRRAGLRVRIERHHPSGGTHA